MSCIIQYITILYYIPAVMVLVKSEDEKPRVGEVMCDPGEEGVWGEVGVTLSVGVEGVCVCEEGGREGGESSVFLFLLGRIVV